MNSNTENTANNPTLGKPVLAEVQFKLNDVFTFQYNESKPRFEPYHCFDGQLVVKERSTGELYLHDTYWGGNEGKVFTIEEAQTEGTLTFKCNLDEVELITEGDLRYYNESDIFNLSTQHHCYKRFAKRKGAERSKAKMIESIQEKIKDAEYEKRSAERNIERYTETLKKIEAGDTSVYF